MKKIIVFSIFLFFTTAVMAQRPPVKSAEIKTPQATCLACKQIIERMAPQYVEGLVKINVIYQRGITQVQWHPDRTNIEELKTAIANTGFDADDVEAVQEVRARLPECCRSAPTPKKNR